MMSSQKNILIIPYANVADFNTGVNIRNRKNQLEIYLKNCCVACVSARAHCDNNTDVALVSNIEIPNPYKEVLDRWSIKIIRCPFDEVSFGGQYLWALAFYKLCALSYLVRNYEYDNYAYVDSDVYVQRSFDDIWEECQSHLMLYDINHGLQVKDYKSFLNDVRQFFETTGRKFELLPHWGGEFFAAKKEDAVEFLTNCEDVYEKMKESGFFTAHGDEFITSVAAFFYKGRIKNAGAYVFRFWTGVFRLISTCYEFNAVTILHVPSEKEHGMLKIYDKYIRKGVLPDIKKVHGMLHLVRRSLRVFVAVFLLHAKRVLALK